MNTEEEFQSKVSRHSEVISELRELNEYFEEAVAKAVNQGTQIFKELKKLYPYTSFDSLPTWFYSGSCSEIIQVEDNYISFKGYERGYGGDADVYPEFRISTDFVKLYYTDRKQFDQFFLDIKNSAIQAYEDKKKKAALAAELAEKAKFEELKKKYEKAD